MRQIRYDRASKGDIRSLELKSLVERALEDLDETQEVEFKSPAPFNTIRQKLKRTALAMANTNGGIIIIGVKERTRELLGVETHRDTYLQLSTKGQIAEAGAPMLQLEIFPHYRDGKDFVVIAVTANGHLHISKADDEPDKDGVRAGVIYYRTVKPANIPVTDDTTWSRLIRGTGVREMQELARTMKVVGCELGSRVASSHSMADDDRRKFEQQLDS